MTGFPIQSRLLPCGYGDESAMSDTDDTTSGNTQQHSQATELFTTLSALTTVAATTTIMIAGSVAQSALFISLLVATALGIHLYREDE